MNALKIAALRGLRTTIQSLAGVAAAIPLMASFTDAKAQGVIAAWATLGAVIGGIAAFLQNYAEALEDV
jgi:hypothetical protein